MCYLATSGVQNIASKFWLVLWFLHWFYIYYLHCVHFAYTLVGLFNKLLFWILITRVPYWPFRNLIPFSSCPFFSDHTPNLKVEDVPLSTCGDVHRWDRRRRRPSPTSIKFKLPGWRMTRLQLAAARIVASAVVVVGHHQF